MNIQNEKIEENEIDPTMKRRLVGVILFLLSFLPLIAIVSYDWHDIAALAIPPSDEPHNYIGTFGANFAYCSYTLIGVITWLIPLIAFWISAMLICGKKLCGKWKLAGLGTMLLLGTSIAEFLDYSPSFSNWIHSALNAPNAGGAIGYLVMDRLLARYLSPFGASMLLITAFVITLIMFIGFKRILLAISNVFAWASDRSSGKREDVPEETIALIKARNAARERLERAVNEKTEQAAEVQSARTMSAKDEHRSIPKQEPLSGETGERLERPSPSRSTADIFAAERDEPKPAAKAPANDGSADDWISRAASRRSKVAKSPAAKSSAAVETRKSTDEIAGEEPGSQNFELPPTSILAPIPVSSADHGDVEEMAVKLVETLKVFGVNTSLSYTVKGPVVTQYALEPDPGVRVEKISGLSRNLQLVLKASSIRIEAPIPGESAVGIEVPNRVPAPVSFREVFEGDFFQGNVMAQNGTRPKIQVPLLLGKDSTGKDLVEDLATIPHLLVAGATGMGKSVCLNGIINAILMSRTPEEVRLIMVDPKRVEFTDYAKIPHLLIPIVNDTHKVVAALQWAVHEMEERLKLFSQNGCRNISEFNSKPTISQPDLFGNDEKPKEKKRIPYIVIIIDELADIMLTSRAEAEPPLNRLLALARATGIHLILATQRPDVKVIPGTLKANIPGRIAFKTSQSNDSRTILDSIGAECLIGRGDMLYKNKLGKLIRAQGGYIDSADIVSVTSYLAERYSQEFDKSLTKKLENAKDPNEENAEDGSENPSDIRMPGEAKSGKDEDTYQRALEVIKRTKKASISHLQRVMGIGYNNAARIIDLLEARGVVAPAHGAGPRKILIDLTDNLAEDLMAGTGVAEETPATDEETMTEPPVENA